MFMNDHAQNVIFVIVTYGMVLNSNGSEKFPIWKKGKDPLTTTTTTHSTLGPTDGTTLNYSVCSQNPVKGDCRAHLERWYYNTTSGNCSVFYYGGCRGNENRFRTCEQCMKNCELQNESATASNITEVCRELEEAAEENDSWEVSFADDANKSVHHDDTTPEEKK
ncbi:amyloid-beta precursor protein-like [Rhipicephalus sanguineus]|uniref:amyloid-beta precursor protein-like n=1 Tax=Rhipicephalus sanguineus TaxID=34632 RepID=UPI0020C2C73F|nr:amyloid-beta precursor protein-like [Rhipicephalus sanguineus]